MVNTSEGGDLNDMDLFLGIVILVTAVVIYYVWKEIQTNRSLPPGPWAPLPLIGTASRLDPRRPFLTLTDWTAQYGDVFSFSQLGGIKTVVCNDEASIKEVLIGPNSDFLSDRPDTFRNNLLRPGRRGVAFGNMSPAWISMKRAMMTSLKMFGDGLDRLEEITIDVLNEMSGKFSDHGHDAFDPNYYLSQCTAKIIGTLTYGSLPSKEEVTLFSVVEEQDTALLVPGGRGSELDWFPWLRFFMRGVYRDLQNIANLHWFVFDSLLQKSQAEADLNEPRCAMDSLFRIKERIQGDPRIPEQDKLTDSDMHLMSRDLIIAGTVTTHRALYSLLAILATHPNVQRALQEEVDRVCGERQPLIRDKSQMHYTMATIFELFRYNSEVPLLVPHVASRDTTIAGYRVPKGTQVWCNVYNLHHSERYWEKPEEFTPERYLDENSVIVPSDHPNKTRLLVFGAGRRQCPGENLAKNRVFLFLATFMQKFTFKPVEGAHVPRPDPRHCDPGLTILPQPYKIYAIPREK